MVWRMNLNDMQAWQYFAIAGGGVLVLGVITYFLPIGKTKLPGVVTAAFGGVVAGLALGVMLMASFGYKVNREDQPSNNAGPPGGTGAPKGMPKAIGMPGNFGPPAPSPRDQLASLVTALDNVADRPLAVNLTTEEKAAIVKELKSLTEAAEVNNEDARARLDAIQKIVEKHQKTLETVGYRTGPAPKGGTPKDNPNPFKTGPAAEHLKSLLDRLSK